MAIFMYFSNPEGGKAVLPTRWAALGRRDLERKKACVT
jgi:hypothetical protein